MIRQALPGTRGRAGARGGRPAKQEGAQTMAKKLTNKDLDDALASGKAGKFKSPEADARFKDWVKTQQDFGRDLKSGENAIGLYVLNSIANSGVLRSR